MMDLKYLGFRSMSVSHAFYVIPTDGLTFGRKKQVDYGIDFWFWRSNEWDKDGIGRIENMDSGIKIEKE